MGVSAFFDEVIYHSLQRATSNFNSTDLYIFIFLKIDLCRRPIHIDLPKNKEKTRL